MNKARVFLSILFVAPLLTFADSLLPGETYVVCNKLFVYKKPRSVLLNNETNETSSIRDGVYQTKNPWCLYKIENGFAEEIDGAP